MTDTDIFYSPAELGFSHPLNYVLVSRAAPFIVENLNQVMDEYGDNETRWADQRRVHGPMSMSRFFAFYRGNSVVITNRLPDGSDQFRYLHKGNGLGRICAKHRTLYRAKDGTIRERPGVMKFYDKRSGSWMYRHCVRPISQDVINTFNKSIERAVFQGLEQARWEIGQEADIDPDIFTISEDIGAVMPTETMEEVFYESVAGSIVTDKQEEQIVEEKQTIISRVMEGAERAYRKAAQAGKSLLGKFRRR
jgi:hypothetical protein